MKQHIRSKIFITLLMVISGAHHSIQAAPIGLNNKGNTCFLNALLQNLLNMTELNNELLLMPEQKLSAQDSSKFGLSKLLLNIPTVHDTLFTQQNLSLYERGVLENQIKLQKQLQAYRELYLAIHTDHSPTSAIIDEKLATFVTSICRQQWDLNVGSRQEDPTEALQKFFPSMSTVTEPWKWFVYLVDEQKIQFNNNSSITPKTATRYNIPLTYQNNKSTIDALLRADKWQCDENLACSKKNSFDQSNTKNSTIELPVNTSTKTIQQAIDLYQQEEIIDSTGIDIGQDVDEVRLQTDSRKKSTHIFSQSNYLIVSLKRFEGIFDQKLHQVIFKKISIPTVIQKNITIPNKENGSVAFELIGIIIHSGATMQSGHYVTYIADQHDIKHDWYLCDDKIVTPVPNMFHNEIAVGLGSYNPTTDGYVLFYKRANYNPMPLISNMQLHNDLMAIRSLIR